MTGAEELLAVLVQGGIDTCFANPGTSEMQLVTAIGRSERIRPVLCLFEGVVTGAADGYARMMDRPALTLLHLGPGLGNGLANLHNAKKAHVPMVNLVGNHAVRHLQYEAPLTSDVQGYARLASHWVEMSTSPEHLVQLGSQAIQAANQGSGHIATLIVPADHAWSEVAARPGQRDPLVVKQTVLDPCDLRVIPMAVAGLRSGKQTALILGGRALREEPLQLAGRLAEATGVHLFYEPFCARIQRGAGRVRLQTIPYFAEQAVEVLKGFEQIILVGAPVPIAFFAYPGKPSELAPPKCEILQLTTVHQDPVGALRALGEAFPLPAQVQTQPRGVPALPTGALTPEAVGDAICALLPEGSVVVDEALTCSSSLFQRTVGALPHDWLFLTGGAIGDGLPTSLGVAVACPDRKVVALQADGSGMYTVQTLWSLVRERADVTVVILNNKSYAILNIELARVGVWDPPARTKSMFSLEDPCLNWVDLAQGMGMRGIRVTTAAAFNVEFAQAMARRGPCLIEVMIVQSMSMSP